MAGKVHALRLDPGAAGGVEIEDRKGPGQAAAALGHIDDVRIGRTVMVEQVTVQAQVRGEGLGQGRVGPFIDDPFRQPFGGVAGQGPDRQGVTKRPVVDGAGNGRFQQREGLVPGLSGLRQRPDRFIPGHALPLPRPTIPRRWRGNRPGASATMSIRST